jgi:hypothetical protein
LIVANGRFVDMALEYKCKIKDDLVNQLIALNNKLNTLSTSYVHNQQVRAEIQELRETLHVDIKRHRSKGHEGKPCPADKHLPYRPKIY